MTLTDINEEKVGKILDGANEQRTIFLRELSEAGLTHEEISHLATVVAKSYLLSRQGVGLIVGRK